MFLTSLPCIMLNLVSMAVHLLWLLLVGRNPPPPLGKEDILKAVGIRVKDRVKGREAKEFPEKCFAIV